MSVEFKEWLLSLGMFGCCFGVLSSLWSILILELHIRTYEPEKAERITYRIVQAMYLFATGFCIYWLFTHYA